MRTLRRGGRQQVATAVDELRNEACTLRFLSPAMRHDPLARAALRREGELQAAVAHRAILPVRAGVMDASLGWVVAAAPIEGATIASRFRSQAAFRREQAFAFVDTVADALETAAEHAGHGVTFAAADICIREDDSPLLLRLQPCSDPARPARAVATLLDTLLRGAGGGRVAGHRAGESTEAAAEHRAEGSTGAAAGTLGALRGELAERSNQDRELCRHTALLEERGESLLGRIDAEGARRLAPRLVEKIEVQTARADACRREGDEQGYAERLAQAVEALAALDVRLAKRTGPQPGSTGGWRGLLGPATAGLLAGLVFALAGIPGARLRDPAPPTGAFVPVAMADAHRAKFTVRPAWPRGSGRTYQVRLPSRHAVARSALVWRLDGRVVARGVDRWTWADTSAGDGRILHVTIAGADHLSGLWHLMD